MSQAHHQVVIVGGGTGGITVAAQLLRGWFNHLNVAVIEPSEDHYYQPLWTLVGAGAATREQSRKAEQAVMPSRAKWIHDSVEGFFPEEGYVTLKGGGKVGYDFLVVAMGIQINWHQIPGLSEALGHNGVCSNYSPQFVNSTWENIRNFQGGRAVFTHPSGAVKCGGAPQKICYLADDYFRRSGVRDKTDIMLYSANPSIFAVEKYRKTLEEVVRRKEIQTHFQHDLAEIRGDSREAVFRNLKTQEEVVQGYEMIHVTPPMGPPDVISQSPLADGKGWLEVDKHTLQHPRFSNVFALGDCSNLPTSKTGAAIRKQAPVLVTNLQAVMAGKSPTASYDGYTSCPLITGYGKLVLAEFDYDKKPHETFPFDQSRERRSMYLLKKYLLPLIYWHGMLRGRM